MPRTQHHADTFYLRRACVENFCGFSKAEVDFTSPGGGHRQMTLLVGENGAGKSSFLRAIALGLCQQSEASALLKKLAGDSIRIETKESQADYAVIDLEFFVPGSPSASCHVLTTITRDSSGQETLEKVTKYVPDGIDRQELDFPWPAVFLAGYGVNRGAGARAPTPSEYSRSAAATTLFDDAAGLLDPEDALRYLKLASFEGDSRNGDSGKAGEEGFDNIVRHLKSVLQLAPDHRIEVTSRGVMVHGPWGALPLHALGDGYRGTSSWLLDLWFRAHLAEKLSTDGQPAGIVLVDEIDEHLHPSWQRKLVPGLRQRFPKLQFIGTTHSPMSIVNCRPDELFAAELREGKARLSPLTGPEGKSADRILRGEWFGLPSTLDDESEKLLQIYQAAVREKQPENEVAPLREALRDRFGRQADSPLDELALEIADEVQKKIRRDTSPSQRRELISEAAQKLRQRLRHHGFKRGVEETPS